MYYVLAVDFTEVQAGGGRGGDFLKEKDKEESLFKSNVVNEEDSDLAVLRLSRK